MIERAQESKQLGKQSSAKQERSPEKERINISCTQLTQSYQKWLNSSSVPSRSQTSSSTSVGTLRPMSSSTCSPLHQPTKKLGLTPYIILETSTFQSSSPLPLGARPKWGCTSIRTCPAFHPSHNNPSHPIQDVLVQIPHPPHYVLGA